MTLAELRSARAPTAGRAIAPTRPAETERAETIILEAVNLLASLPHQTTLTLTLTLTLTSLAAFCVQHEFDHLDRPFLFDRLSVLRT